MSIYQNTYFIIPREGNYSLFEGINLKSFLEDEYMFEDDLFWENLKYNYENYKKQFSDIFEIGESWSENIKNFGDNELNCLSVIVEDRLIVSISFRINFKTDYSSFIERLIEFCINNDFLIVDNDLNILDLDSKSIEDNILGSNAYKRYRKFGNGGNGSN